MRRGFGRARRGPTLLGTAARTAVIAGTATSVAGRVAGNQQAAADRDRQLADVHQQQQAAALQAQVDAQVAQALLAVQQSAPPAADTGDMLGQLTKLGDLRAAGVLTEDEFATQNARILSS